MRKTKSFTSEQIKALHDAMILAAELKNLKMVKLLYTRPFNVTGEEIHISKEFDYCGVIDEVALITAATSKKAENIVEFFLKKDHMKNFVKGPHFEKMVRNVTGNVYETNKVFALVDKVMNKLDNKPTKSRRSNKKHI